MTEPYVVAASLFLTALAFCWAGYHLVLAAQKRQQLDSRLVELGADPVEASIRRKSLLLQLGDRFDRSEAATQIERMLIQADLPLRPSEYLAGIIGVGGVIFLLGILLLQLNFLLNLALAVLGAIYLPRLFLASRRNHYIEAFNDQLVSVALLMGNSLRAGLSVPQAVEVIAQEMPPPAGREFAILDRELKLGASIEDGIQHMLDRLPSTELKVMMTAILVQRRAGGNLAKALSEMSHTMVQRKELHDEVRTMTAEARFIALIVPLIPIGLLIMMKNSMPALVNPLFETPIGLVVLAVYGALQVLAYILIRQISDIKV